MDRRINLLAQLITEDPNTNKSHLYKRAILAERRLLREAPAAAAPPAGSARPAAPAAAPGIRPAAPAAQPAAAAPAAAPQAQVSSSRQTFLDQQNQKVYAVMSIDQKRALTDPATIAQLKSKHAANPDALRGLDIMSKLAQADPALKATAAQAAPAAAPAKSITGVAARKPVPNDVKVAQPLLITLQKAIPALKKIDFKDANAAAQWYAANGGGQGIVNLLKQPANAQALARVLLVGQIK